MFFFNDPKKKHDTAGPPKTWAAIFGVPSRFRSLCSPSLATRPAACPVETRRSWGGNTDDERQVPSALTWGDHNVHWAHLRLAEHSPIAPLL